MLTVMFWNLCGRDRAQLCARLAHRYGVTVLFLAECIRPLSVHRALNPTGQPARYYSQPKTDCRVAAFSTLERTELPILDVSRHFAVHRLVLPTAPELLLATAHLPSKLRTSEEEQERILRRFAGRLNDLEDRRSHSRTLVLGDLNANPYQRGVVSADGLHGVPTRAIAMKGHRVVGGKRYKMFYNPMWRFFGDGRPGPSGTYFRWRAEHDCVFWYLFDQVLIRPDLIPYCADPDIEIVTTDGETSFVRPDGTPDADVGSDHLPVLVRLAYPGV
jgi:hypothetical protein